MNVKQWELFGSDSVLQLQSSSSACNVMISRGMAAPITSTDVAVIHNTRTEHRGAFQKWGIPASPN